MLISIIIPTYNSTDYIVEALDSCLRQDYSNIELIISDDVSQDDTVDVIQAWIENHEQSFDRVYFCAQEKNLGVRDNTNFLIKQAKGEYVRLLEGDDILVDGSIKKQVDFLEENSDTIYFMFSELLIFNDDVNDTEAAKWSPQTFINGSAYDQYCMLLYGQRANGPSVFFHRQKILDCGGYIGARNCADWTTIISLTKQGVRAVQYPEPLLYYRRHGSNISDRETDSWKKLNYEMKQMRNEELLVPQLHWKHKLYCHQDLLAAKRTAGEPLDFGDRLNLFILRKLYRLLK